MTFEVFQRPRAAKGPLLVTVTAEGVIRMNAAAYRAIDQPTHVLLLTDTEHTGTWAIRAVAGASAVTWRVGRSGVLCSSEFVRAFQLAPGRYPAWVSDEMLVVR